MKITMQKQQTNVGIEQAFNEFIKYCKVKNLSESTIEFYNQGYEKFIGFMGNSASMEGVDANTIQDYTLFLKESNICPVSVNTFLRAARAFLYYCMKLDYIKPFTISLIKVEKEIKETYTDNELQALLKKPDVKSCTFIEYRNWVMVNYLLATGNRLSTVINIKIKDVDFENECIMLQKTKNKRQQIIPLSHTVIRILQEYLTYRKGTPEDYLFCNTKGQAIPRNKLEHDIANYNKKRGVSKTSIHLFRHTFAKKWILSGGDIFRLQKILGHSSLEIVKEYVNMFTEDLKQDFNRFNPLEQITKTADKIKLRAG